MTPFPRIKRKAPRLRGDEDNGKGRRNRKRSATARVSHCDVEMAIDDDNLFMLPRKPFSRIVSCGHKIVPRV